MADLRNLTFEEIRDEFHKRLAGQSAAEAGKSLIKSAYAAVPGNDETNPSQTQTPKQPDYQLPTQPSVNTAQFIGQGGQIETRPYEPLAPTPVYGRGGQITGLLPTIDARAPVKYGGALTGNSLGSEEQFRAKFAPSPDLAALTSQNQANAVSKINVFDPVRDLQQFKADTADYSNNLQYDQLSNQNRVTAPTQLSGQRLAQSGAYPSPTPNPTPEPPNFYDKQKKKDQYGNYA